MANFLDRFLNSMKLYDDDEDDDEDYEDYESEEETPAPRRPFRRKAEQPANEEKPASRRSAPVSSASRGKRTPDNVVPMKNAGTMEVCMVKPTALDDAREICDILLSGKAVVINMEGVHVDLAQRIIDFTSGSCYSINGNLQKISKYIFIVSPHTISLSGDFQDTVEDSRDLSTLSLNL